MGDEELVCDTGVAVVDVEVCGKARLSGEVWDCLYNYGRVRERDRGEG